MRSSFCISPSSILLSGTPDHRETTCGDVLLADLFLEQRVIALHLDEPGLLLLERALQLVELAVAELGGATEVTRSARRDPPRGAPAPSAP